METEFLPWKKSPGARVCIFFLLFIGLYHHDIKLDIAGIFGCDQALYGVLSYSFQLRAAGIGQYDDVYFLHVVY